ncbi:sensor histidine kinase [Paenibacillaceae bacterium WGS1546]|uniref:sensor histidine kinase n=1 Tax=Cohnella sp. WGS1546 TaxID=3366810 RepID=UPI00372D0D71
MTYDETGIKWGKATLWRNEWTRGLNRRPLIRAADDRTMLFALAAIAAAMLLPLTFGEPVMDGDAAAAYAGFVLLTCSLQTFHAKEALLPPAHRRELAWLAVGGMAYPVGVADRLYYEGWPVIGLTFVFACSAAGIVMRVRQVRREAERNAAELRIKRMELERFQRNVERMVELRTAELEKANRSLAFTLREKAETLAEMSVLEERSRIAHEIHDVVGHTLTAAIVQLEATKTLAEQQNRVPWDKLELLSGLVRKGLDDIRRAVKLMKSDEAQSLTLEAALRELIQYTEDTMEIEIEADIALPPKPELGRLTEQVLYHALQEGLTNGIRHGKCGRARFTLRSSGKTLRFRLVSDGEPYGSAVPGFGLSSMIERVKLLGGEVAIRSSADAGGRPVGCELSIDLPLDG